MELSALAGVASRVGAVADVRAAGERIAVGTRLLLPLLQSSTTAPTELAGDLRTALAGRDSVTLVLPAAANAAARLDVGARQFALPPTLRDALLAALGAQAQGARQTPAAVAANPAANAAASPAANPATAGALAGAGAGANAVISAGANAATLATADAARNWAIAAQTTAAAGIAVSGSGAPRAVARGRDDAPPPVLRFSPPLFEPVNAAAAVEAAAGRMRSAVERSGLFFEAHLAQWADGRRDTAELRAEALRLPAPGAAGGEAERAAQRVATQVALLQDGVLRLEGEAWPGQSARLAVQRDSADGDGADAAEPVFTATIAFDLPQLGPVEVTLRLAGSAISATVASADAPRLAPALEALAGQFEARGLRPVLLQSVAAQEPA